MIGATAVSNARGYDWQSWRIGIMRSFLSGGATALMTLGGSALVQIPRRDALVLMGINFVVMGCYRMGEFLQLHGAPDQLQAALDKADTSAKETAAAVSEAKAIAPEAK